MRRAVAALLSVGLIVVLAGSAQAALPPESPSDTYGVNGRVRAIAVVGDNVWIAGTFTGIVNDSSTVIRQSVGLAVLSKTTGQFSTTADAPKLTGTSVEVWNLAVDSSGRVYAAGKFAYNGTSKKNLISFDGTTGGSVTTYNSPVARSVTVADRVYAGGHKLIAFPIGGGAPDTTFPQFELTDAVGGHNPSSWFRDLEIGPDGKLYVACQCSDVKNLSNGDVDPANALTRIDIGSEDHDQAYAANVKSAIGSGAFGVELQTASDGVYLAAGGSDFTAKFGSNGNKLWHHDTSGSSQSVTLTADGAQLIVGGHFQWVADQDTAQCGSNSSPNTNCTQRLRLMALNPSNGDLLSWDPVVCCNYNGVWATTVDGARLHLGGEFKKVHGVAQYYYARLG